jgi:hypothetical protein
MKCAATDMNKPLKQILFWMPRLAGSLFALFLSLFAFDVFGMQLGFWGTLAALFMHLIPSLLLAVAVILAWRWEWVGAVLFIGWGVWYGLSLSRGDFDLMTFLLIGGIPALVGLFFLAGWIWRRQIRAS